MTEKYETVEDRVSYGIGRQMGEQLMASAFDGMNTRAVIEGVESLMRGDEQAISEEDLHEAYSEIAGRVQVKKSEEGKALAQAGVDYLTENAKRSEVVVCESGLQYEVLEEGNGDKPSAESTVRVHYRGQLIDGNTFDSSYERGQPTEFPVNGVIPGWIEALQMMPVGAKWKVFIPYQLAYGEKGAGGMIAPFATLIFEVELVEIVS